MIQVADGEWREGDTLYFYYYNPIDPVAFSPITEFIPKDVIPRSDNIVSFVVIDCFLVPSDYCYLNRHNAVERGKSVLFAELRELDKREAAIRAKIDELEKLNEEEI